MFVAFILFARFLLWPYGLVSIYRYYLGHNMACTLCLSSSVMYRTTNTFAGT